MIHYSAQVAMSRRTAWIHMHTFHLDRWLVVRGLVKGVQVLQKYLLLGEDSSGTCINWTIRYCLCLAVCINRS